MSTTESTLTQLANDWREAQLLYPLYRALSREFVIEVQPCAVLETITDVPDRDTVEEAREWLALLDGRTQVHQLRQFLQTTSLANEEMVKALLVRHLRKPIKTDADRDKIDFLLRQSSAVTPISSNACKPSKIAFRSPCISRKNTRRIRKLERVKATM